MARIRRTKPGQATEPEENGTVRKEVNELAGVLRKADNNYGVGMITLGSQRVQPDRIPTGMFMFDLATLGGIPANRISHVIGERSAGKSLSADKIIAGAQLMYPDQTPVKVDVEGTHDSIFSGKLGVDLDRLYVAQPETGEAAIDIVDAMIHTKEVSLIVLDSIAALVPMKEIESSAEDALVALQSQMIGRMIRKATAGLISERRRGHYVTVLFINQFRMKVGVNFGDPRSAPGGKALEFCASLQWIVKNKEIVGKDEYDVEGVTENEHSFLIQKNKMNGGIRSGEFIVRRTPDAVSGLNEGDVDDAQTILAYARKFGAYTGAGSSWNLLFEEDSHHFRGVQEAAAALYKDPDLKWRLRNFILATHASHLGMPQDFIDRFKNG